MQAGNYEPAIRELRALLAQTQSPRVKLELARALFLKGEYREARSLFNDVLVDPDTPWRVRDTVFVVLFWRLGDATFWDPDEAHYAETSREMIATGDWWAPYYNEQPFFDKPVLFHQLQASACSSVRRAETSARSESAMRLERAALP